MNLAVKLGRSLKTDMQAELRDIERAVAAGTREAGHGLRTELRRQVASAGLGQRLGNSWRDQHYPNQKLDAASLVYTMAPQIIRAFDEGAVIRSKRGRFLAIPTESAPRKGTDGRRISPSTFPEHRFGPLRFVQRTVAARGGRAAGFAQSQERGAAWLPARQRSSPSTGRWSDHRGDVSARAAGALVSPTFDTPFSAAISPLDRLSR